MPTKQPSMTSGRYCSGGMSFDRKERLAAVGPRLRALRQRHGLTLAALAERTGINESTLSRLEGGTRKPTLEMLLPLAEVYAVPLDELVGAPRTGDPCRPTASAAGRQDRDPQAR